MHQLAVTIDAVGTSVGTLNLIKFMPRVGSSPEHPLHIYWTRSLCDDGIVVVHLAYAVLKSSSRCDNSTASPF